MVYANEGRWKIAGVCDTSDSPITGKSADCANGRHDRTGLKVIHDLADWITILKQHEYKNTKRVSKGY